MWFVVDDDQTVWMTTYRKSQKVVNIRRDAKVALHVESGVTYDRLKGVLVRGDAEVIDDEDACVRTLVRIHEKMNGALAPGLEDAMRGQARKRVVLKVTPRRASSWDHSKLGGVY
jgi:nitroimidazol reductase NimA-like FMN-containing flavoprotein (pyridoxamine 5'-phosphate oxidase superfamily)